jgi:hypothetical protein
MVAVAAMAAAAQETLLDSSPGRYLAAESKVTEALLGSSSNMAEALVLVV